MTNRSSGGDDVSIRIPRRLRDRVNGVFKDYRGYEPASFQEALSLVCNLAEERIDASTTAGMESSTQREMDGHFTVPQSSSSVVSDGETAPLPESVADVETGVAPTETADSPAPPDDYDTVIDQVFPYDWDANPTVRRRLPAVVERFVENPAGVTDPEERERDAIKAVAVEEGTDPEFVRESLVSTLYGGAGLSNHLAGEFFSEALGEAETVAGRQQTGERTATSDGGVASDPTPDSLSELIEMGADDAPTADCEGCGGTMPVGDLETVIGPEEGSTVHLLCPDCADGAR